MVKLGNIAIFCIFGMYEHWMHKRSVCFNVLFCYYAAFHHSLRFHHALILNSDAPFTHGGQNWRACLPLPTIHPYLPTMTHTYISSSFHPPRSQRLWPCPYTPLAGQ